MTAVRLSGVLLWLTALWLLLWADLSVANVAAGLAVGVGVLTVARLPRLGRRDDEAARIAPFSLLYFVVFFFYKLVEANLIIAWEIITPGSRIKTGIVAVPLRTESTTAMLVVSSAITLTPGTITIEAIGSPPVLYVNVLHLYDIDRVRRDALHLEELAVRAFGSPAARAQLRSAS